VFKAFLFFEYIELDLMTVINEHAKIQRLLSDSELSQLMDGCLEVLVLRRIYLWEGTLGVTAELSVSLMFTTLDDFYRLGGRKIDCEDF
jgi:hypothetical protein